MSHIAVIRVGDVAEEQVQAVISALVAESLDPVDTEVVPETVWFFDHMSALMLQALEAFQEGERVYKDDVRLSYPLLMTSTNELAGWYEACMSPDSESFEELIACSSLACLFDEERYGYLGTSQAAVIMSRSVWDDDRSKLANDAIRELTHYSEKTTIFFIIEDGGSLKRV